MLPRKLVRALRTGSYEGHRRRRGAEFTVPGSAKESWFEDIGPAPAGDVAPTQLQNGQATKGKSFVDLMREQGEAQAPPSTSLPTTGVTLAEGAATLPNFPAPVVEEPLV